MACPQAISESESFVTYDAMRSSILRGFSLCGDAHLPDLAWPHRVTATAIPIGRPALAQRNQCLPDMPLGPSGAHIASYPFQVVEERGA